MGIRFACHVCDKHLNIKQELAGRRGVCPACSSRFRIPLEDAEKSTPIETKPQVKPIEAPTSGNGSAPVSEGPQEPSSTTAASLLPSELDSIQSEVGSINLLDEDGDATWYVRPPSGGQYGPASAVVLKQWINEGRVASSSLLWRDGWPQWRDASEALPELAMHLPQGNASSVSTASSAAAAPANEADQSSPAELSGQHSMGAQHRSRSMQRAMLVSILSVVALALIGILVIVVNR